MLNNNTLAKLGHVAENYFNASTIWKLQDPPKL